MMKYSLCHPESFTHPHIAFLMGLIQFFSVVVSESINIAKASQRTTPQELITSYIGFKAIMDVPTIYYSSINSIAVKGDVGKVVATKGRKELRGDNEKMIGHGLANFIYIVHKWFYNVFYFYFFTFSVIGLPLTQVLIAKEKATA
jgi:hypothetical protein